MANGNGHWVKWLVGSMFTIAFFAITTMGGYIVANDKEGRARDSKTEEKLAQSQGAQNAINTQMLVTLAKIDGKFDTVQMDLNYIKKQIDK